MKDEKKQIIEDSPTLTYRARSYESNRPKPSPHEKPNKNNGIKLHTFNDWQSIKEDSTINIDFFINSDQEENVDEKDDHRKTR